VETILGKSMRKEHSAVDWSKRPLPESWLEYAALDVEVLLELREFMVGELEEAGKAEWARQEFEYLLTFEPTQRAEPWRRTSQLHRVRGRRALAAVRELWEARNAIAAQRDITPGRILPDAAVIEAALALPQDRATLLKTKGFHGRGAERYAGKWVTALKIARELPEDELPQRGPRGDGPPVPRAWAEKDPVAARRLVIARESTLALAKENNLPVENLLTPDYLRRVLWSPPDTRDPAQLTDEVAAALTAYGARRWQVELTAPVLTQAILDADQAEEPEPTDEPEATDEPEEPGPTDD
jgi:ribonuclease D